MLLGALAPYQGWKDTVVDFRTVPQPDEALIVALSRVSFASTQCIASWLRWAAAV